MGDAKPGPSRRRKARAIIVGPPEGEDPGAPTPEEVYGTGGASIPTEDLKFERRTKRIDRTLTTMEKLDRPKALEARIPAVSGRRMSKARRNILAGLELVDIVEQTRAIDDIMGYVALAEQSIFGEMKMLVDGGCNIETLTGDPMRLPKKEEHYLGPEDPSEASIIFHDDCWDLYQLHSMLIRLKKLEARAETQASIWGEALKNFRKKVDFEDRASRELFLAIGEWVEAQEVKEMKRKMKELREEREQ